MGRPTRYPPPFRAQAVAHVARIRPEHRSTWQAIKTVAAALGVSTETLRGWVRQAEIADGHGQHLRHQQQAELQRLHQENTRLRQTLGRLRGTGDPPAAPTRRPETYPEQHDRRMPEAPGHRGPRHRHQEEAPGPPAPRTPPPTEHARATAG
ncbi:transposase IS3/IS911 family protein [Parafrankia sp. EAN1pec]|nr:transposase IS3/IS911 family protein [Frankia sp. EAN1pec]